MYRSKLLTQKEKIVLQLIVEGKTNREIATNLNISYSTAKTHVSNILEKTGFKNRIYLAIWAVMSETAKTDIVIMR